MSEAFHEAFSGEEAAYWLDVCLEQMAQGRPREEALQRVPEAYRAEVASLLPMAQALQEAPRVTPRKDFRRQAWPRLRHALAQRTSARQGTSWPWRFFRLSQGTRSSRWSVVWAGLMALLAALFVGVTLTYASADALPGDPLYPVKIWTENLQLWLAGPERDLELYERFVQRRLEEIHALMVLGRYEDVPQALQRWEEQRQRLTAAFQTLPPDQRAYVLTALLQREAVHEQQLARLIEDAPPQAQSALAQAYETSQKWREALQQALEAPTDCGPASGAPKPPHSTSPCAENNTSPHPSEKGHDNDPEREKGQAPTQSPSPEAGQTPAAEPTPGQGQGQGQGQGRGQGQGQGQGQDEHPQGPGRGRGKGKGKGQGQRRKP